MASAAAARRPAEAPRREQTRRAPVRATRPAQQTRRQAASQARLTRAIIIFVVCLAVLAAGRVAMSFAVVQKTVATDAIAREERGLAAENAQLEEELAQLGSTVRIRAIAENRLGLVETTKWETLVVAEDRATKADTRP